MTTCSARIPATRLVSAGLDRATEAIRLTVHGTIDDTPEAHAARALRVSQLYARRARWWAVLGRICLDDHTVHVVYLCAVGHARAADEMRADTWTATAEQWTSTALAARDRAGGEPG